MPYQPTTPTVVLCTQLAAAVQQAWAPTDGVSAANWNYFVRFGDADNISVPALAGRQVVFFPTDYDWETGTRSENAYTHHVSCLIVERYGDGTQATAGDPPQDWTSERVDFVHTQIVEFTRYTQSGPAPFNLKLMTLRGSVEVLDVKKLVTGGRLFYSLVQIEFFEMVNA